MAVVGFSWGGLANVLAAAKDDRIKAIVSLDGSVRGTREFVDGGKDAAQYVTPARVAIPMLFVGRRPPTIEELNRSEVDTRFSFLNEMKYSDVYIVSMLPMKHMDFSSYYLRMAQDGQFGDYTRDEIALAHSWAARYVRHFLDAKLKNDAAGLAFIDSTPQANKAPAHMMISDTRRGKGGVPPTFENFIAQLASGGFDKAVPIYDKMAGQGASFKLGPNEIYGRGSELANRAAEAGARDPGENGADEGGGAQLPPRARARSEERRCGQVPEGARRRAGRRGALSGSTTRVDEDDACDVRLEIPLRKNCSFYTPTKDIPPYVRYAA